MPTVPEALGVPRSLGGLLTHMHDDAGEEASLGGLVERTQELTEDINERAQVVAKLAEIDPSTDAEVSTPVEPVPEADEE